MKVKKRFLGLFTLSLILLLVLSYFSIVEGTIGIKDEQLKKYLFEGTTGNNTMDLIIEKLRLPRTVGAIIVGLGIAVAGILMQGYFRNPLADPYLMGVASGASLGVVLYIFTSLLFNMGIPHSIYGFIISAYIGSLITMFIVISIARIIRQTATLLICGIMIGAIASGLTTLVVYTGDYIGEENSKLAGYFMWGMGSVNNLTWTQINLMAVILIPIVILAYIFLSKKLDANLLGEKYAISVGVDVKNLKKWLIILSCILTATVVAFAGPIAFVGLVCPIIARMLCNTSKHMYVIPMTAILGSVFVLFADILTRPGVIVPQSSNNLPLLCPLSIVGAPIAIVIYLKVRKMGV
ncbi:FecCD family ABC transporter permease [Methanothermococcus okinawensis]|uniref:ABC-type transporter, integral membrane subunit n=1 Tax=Methanothermococcus okinawensis (strain DSM 14208 / JCM 11175 / IH1) TaxID=647113 RepID=F8AM97_METOI|nr:iron ABC transporter permease [Methanothermococcus okinawensis]AEH06787.1 ABC-type transporter, integral membrane subunit [Methanothermococcus okinawensis IH1]